MKSSALREPEGGYTAGVQSCRAALRAHWKSVVVNLKGGQSVLFSLIQLPEAQAVKQVENWIYQGYGFSKQIQKRAGCGQVSG